MKRLLVLGVTGLLMLAGIALSPANAAISAENGRVVFEQGNGKSFTVDPDGSHRQQVDSDESVECTTWAPDGSRVLCNIWTSSGAAPATAEPDGSDLTLLDPSLPLDLFCQYWSPDGSRVLCHSEGIADPSDEGYYTIRSSDGGGLVRLTSGARGKPYEVANGYSPDGSRILFSVFPREGGAGVLYSIRTDGTSMIRLSPERLGVLEYFIVHIGADWSPGGDRVTFAAQDLSNGWPALYVVNADGTALHRVSPLGVGAVSAQWSPDGRLIAFTGCCTSGLFQAWVIRPDGTGLREVTPARHGSITRGPVWSPDGRMLLFIRRTRAGDTSLWTATMHGIQLHKVTNVKAPLGYDWGTATS